MNAPATEALQPHARIVIVGAGFAGLCMAIKLQQSGEHDFVLIERASSVGGTWRDNSYPGAACDAAAHLYSLSFEQNADWSRKFPMQPEIYAYLQRSAERHGLLAKIRFNCEMQGADYDERAQLWRLRTTRGELTACVLVTATGTWSEPRLPDIPGIERFAGRMFHSARWDHGYALSGKRVAVIGTGASAVQFVPEIASQVARLDVYQRTATWVVARPDRALTRFEKFLLRHIKPLQWLYRWLIYWGNEIRVLGLAYYPELVKQFQKSAEKYLRQQVAEPELRRRLTPDYVPGCKRVVMSSDWFAALQRANVSLITESIREIREHAVVTTDGQVREVDALIFATGFHYTENPLARLIRGDGGRSLKDAWADGEQAYLGTLVHGFPNLYLIVGPNTVLAHNSMVFMIEAQVAYIMRCLTFVRERDAATLEVRPEVQEQYNRELQERLRGTVWVSGCRSWYQHRSGRVTTLWPGFSFSFWRRTRRFAPQDYRLNFDRFKEDQLNV